MLLEFVYLNKPTLKGFAAQVDGGLIVETKTRTSRKGGFGANVGVRWLSAKAEGSGEKEQSMTYSDAREAQFQRLLFHAHNDPDALAWIDIMDPDIDFQSAQVGGIVSWECDVDIPNVSRLLAKDGSGAQVIELVDALAEGVADAGLKVGELDGGNLQPAQLAQLQMTRLQAQIAKRLIDRLNAKRAVTGGDNDTGWTVFGTLAGDHLNVDDIDAERLIIVGKIKRVLQPGESRQILDVARLQQLMGNQLKSQKSAGEAPPPGKEHEYVQGPALELTILAIYR
jgi:hypothetical protein